MNSIEASVTLGRIDRERLLAGLIAVGSFLWFL